jgi:hypothetical protein
MESALTVAAIARKVRDQTRPNNNHDKRGKSDCIIQLMPDFLKQFCTTFV